EGRPFVHVSKDVSGVQGDRPVVALDRLAEALQSLQRDASVDISIGLRAVDRQGSVETVQRLLEPLEGEEGNPAKIMNLRLFPIEAENQIEMVHRLGVAAGLVAQKTDHSLRIHVVRPPANDFSEQLFCLIGSAG